MIPLTIKYYDIISALHQHSYQYDHISVNMNVKAAASVIPLFVKSSFASRMASEEQRRQALEAA